MKNNLTTGSPLKGIILFTLPIILGNLFQILYGMTDAAIVGRTLGPDALAAVGATSAPQWLVISFSVGICEGLCFVVSQKFGAKDEKGLKDSVAIGIIIVAITSVVFTFLSTFFLDNLMELINIPQNIYKDCRSYMFTIFSGLGVTIFYNYFASVLRSMGNSKIYLVFLVISCILNVIFDLVFIIIFKMGVFGAGLATLLSKFVLLILCIAYALRKYPVLRLKKENWHINSSYFVRHIKYGLPTALLQCSTGIGNIVSAAYINTLGSLPLAAIAGAQSIEQIVGTTMSATGVTAGTYTAQNYGAREYGRIKVGIRKLTLLMFAFVAVAMVIILSLSTQFVHLFVGEGQAEIERLVFLHLCILLPGHAIHGIIFIYRGALQGIGETVAPFVCGLIELFVRPLVAALFISTIGFYAACIESPAGWLASALPLYICYVCISRKKLKSLQ